MKSISIVHPDANKDWGHGITVAELEKISIKNLKGKEMLYWQYCNIYKVNPALMMAISRQETGGDSNRLVNDHNYGGMKGTGNAGKNGSFAKFSCAEEGIRAHVSLIARNYVGKGLDTIDKIQKKYIPDYDGGKNWAKMIKTFYGYTGKTYSNSTPLGRGVSKEVLNSIDSEVNQKSEAEHIASIKKELMPASLEGKSYSKKDSANSWIVIHNTGGSSTAKSTANHFFNGAVVEGKKVYTSAHYCVDDKEIYQILENTWKGHHAGNPKSGMYGADRGASNNNSIGIEMCDGAKCDKEKAVEIVIELARYLCRELKIPVDNVIQHYDVSGKDCPQWIRNNNKWNYIKTEIKRRNDEQIPISFDPSTIGQTGSGTGSSSSTMPNFDNREDWTNLKEIKGVILNFMPPYHITSTANKAEHFEKYEYDREFHYVVDSAQCVPEKDTSLIAFSMQDNNRHTYIDRALYGNKAPKYTLSVGIFTSPMLEDYTVTEKLLIDNLAKILYENNLNPNDLWREFDLNRAPSPLMYLDRMQWKALLQQVDIQYNWRIKNYGDIETVDPVPDGVDLSLNIGKTGVTTRRCGLREKADMISDFEVLTKGVAVKIIGYQKGFYKVELVDDITKKGWIVWNSIEVSDGTCIAKLLRESNDIPQPEIVPTMTHEQYLKYMEYADPKFIDEYALLHEPYDKGLDEIINAPVSNDDRLGTLTKTQETENENTIHYNVIEATPGGADHCVKPSEELNALYKPDNLRVDPVYPDLIVPPNYSSSDFNKNDSNRIPYTALEDMSIKDEEAFIKQFAFDYDLLNEMNKVSKGKPVNYADPYPYDDKVVELERHHPKVKIDEFESRLYSCNHPGCPIAQPMAKNFAAIIDAMMAQSKKIEQRLVRAENTLAVVLRNQGRMASRVNINCVYYGGQDVFGKYKTIRCLRDDRIHDGCSVTMDQCLACTRFEPIVGQIYEILDETGMNGSAILDDMQMSYMDLDEYKNLNKIENRSTRYKYADVAKTPKETPTSLVDDWKEIDKKRHIEELKKTITDEKELEEKLKAIKEDDYVFHMDWEEQHLELQEPDVKPYPNEGIKAKYKVKIGDAGNPPVTTRTNTSDPESQKENESHDLSETPSIDKEVELDKDFKLDVDNYNKLVAGEWVDTREVADTVEINKYSSENFYFEDFNKDTVSGDASNPGAAWGAEARNKIVEMANIIVEECNRGEAWYEMLPPRTTKHENPVRRDTYGKKNQIIYDCSSFASCCYHHAALTSVVDKTNYDQYKATRDGGGLVWTYNNGGLEKLLPGDLIWHAKHQVSDASKVSGSSHIMVYIGDNKIAHAAKPSRGIVIDECGSWLEDGTYVCGRPKDLIDADAAAASGVGGGEEYTGQITRKDGTNLSCVWKFSKAVLSGYNDIGSFASTGETGIKANAANRAAKKYCAAHNMPHGTKIYIPDYDGVMGENKTGIFTVVDSGGPFFDFDLYVPNPGKDVGKVNKDVYVLEWGTYKHPAISFTYWLEKYSNAQWEKYKGGWHTYKSMNGVTIDFHKFLQDDKTIKSHPRYNS